jgi:hypothetical protein
LLAARAGANVVLDNLMKLASTEGVRARRNPALAVDRRDERSLKLSRRALTSLSTPPKTVHERETWAACGRSQSAEEHREGGRERCGTRPGILPQAAAVLMETDVRRGGGAGLRRKPFNRATDALR